MLQPKRSKHRKAQKGRIREVAKRGTDISFGSYALKSLEAIWLTNRQLEAARQALTRAMKREGNVWIRVFPDKPITKKPQEVRMGKGKGNPEYWAAVVEPGRMLFEADGVTEAVAKEALLLAVQKLEFAHAISPLESPVNIRMLRKDIARLKTELTKRKIGKTTAVTA